MPAAVRRCSECPRAEHEDTMIRTIMRCDCGVLVCNPCFDIRHAVHLTRLDHEPPDTDYDEAEDRES